MASPIEIQNQIDNLQNQIDSFNSAKTVGAGKFQIGDITYTAAQVKSNVTNLQKRIKALKKTIEPYTKAQQKLDDASARLARAKEIAQSPITESPTGMSSAQAQEEVTKAQAEVNKLLASRDKAFSIDYKVTDQGQPAGAEPVVAKPNVPIEQGGLGPVAGMKTESSAFGKGGKGGKGGPGGAGGGTPGGTKDKTAKSTAWEAKFREMFPSQAWMLDIDRVKYADTIELFRKAVDQEVWKTTEGQARFAAQLNGTSFIKELASTDMVRQVKAVVGDLGFDTVPFNAFLTKAMNMGWKDATLKQEIYKEAFRKDDTGKYVNPTAITRAKASNDYLSIAKIGKSYFSTVSDDTIQNVLTGVMMTEDVQRQQRELAKTKYAHLGNLIDQGFTMDELASSFKETASRLLEKDINAIDMSQSDFEQAFNYGEEGKKRMMTTGEWEIKLRTDPRFNWDKTENAKNEARTLADTISKAFGKVI